MSNTSEIIITPNQTESWLRESLSSCKDEFIAVSPFVSEFFADIMSQLSPSINRHLYTRLEISEFASGASRLSAVTDISKSGAIVSILSKLHAKVYIVDSLSALVTSANATRGGLRNNLECGVVVKDADSVARLKGIIESGFDSNNSPWQVSHDYLLKLDATVAIYKKSLPKKRAPEGWDSEYVGIAMSEQNRHALLESLGGWTALTLEGIISFGRDTFFLEEVYDMCEPLAVLRYPENHNIQAKLRQQLQILRDLGFVEFLGGGSYKRLIMKTELFK